MGVYDHEYQHSSSEIVGQVAAKKAQVSEQRYDEELYERVRKKVDKRIIPLVLLQ